MLLDEVGWLGHSGFRIAAGSRTIYIDPYRVMPGARKADLILITHGHYDHFSPQDVERLTKPTTEVIAPAAVAERLSGHVRSIAAGGGIEPESPRGGGGRAGGGDKTAKGGPPRPRLFPPGAGGGGGEGDVAR